MEILIGKTENKIKVSDALKNLKLSTLFNISLGSKELFHSNFLGWLAEKYSEQIGAIFSQYINIPVPKNVKIKPPLREKENIDLTFIYDDGQILIIENKVKSLPTEGQLYKYSQNHSANKSYLLLSLYKPSFVNDNNEFYINDKIKWNFLSYSELSLLLNQIIPIDTYDDFIIKDYIGFIKHLSCLESAILIDWDKDYFDFHSGKINNELDFRSIRIHDFFLKHKYDQIKRKIIEKLEEIVKDSQDFFIIKNGDWFNGKPGDCFFEQGFTNSQGLVGFKFVIKIIEKQSPLVLGLQLQGNSLRLVVECPIGNSALNTARLLKNDGLWFNFTEIEKYQSPVEIKGNGHKNNDKDFASFSGRFFYKYVTIGNVKMTDLLNIIKHYYFHIQTHFSEISKIVNNTR